MNSPFDLLLFFADHPWLACLAVMITSLIVAAKS